MGAASRSAATERTSVHDLAEQAAPFAADACKVCLVGALRQVAHTAECVTCGALLYYPYLDDATLEAQATAPTTAAYFEEWYSRAAPRNHDNFTSMLRFALRGVPTLAPLHLLDYGGGGGQFACVVRSLYPNATVSVTDIADAALLPQWRPFNRQVRFRDFPSDRQRYDAIFLNDVFEHVNDPVAVLQLLVTKLAPGGRVFIDTPRPSWLYPVLRVAAPRLYRRLLTATVSRFHLQLWTRRALAVAARHARLTIVRYAELAEFTCPADDYLDGIGMRHPLLRLAGTAYHRWAHTLRAHNKIMAVLEPTHRISLV